MIPLVGGIKKNKITIFSFFRFRYIDTGIGASVSVCGSTLIKFYYKNLGDGRFYSHVTFAIPFKMPNRKFL